ELGQMLTAIACLWTCQGVTPEAQQRLDEAQQNFPLMILAVQNVPGGAGTGKLFRFGKEAEPAEKLGREAAAAEARGFPHGVSTTTRTPTRTAASEASFPAVEQRFP